MSSIELVKEVHNRSGVGITSCKKALEEAEWDTEKALDLLRKKGLTKTVDPLRVASEGRVHSYLHHDGSIGVLLEVNCETDFAARTQNFKDFCDSVAMHIAGTPITPRWVTKDEVPLEAIEHQKTLIDVPADKPLAVQEKIGASKLDKWFKDVCLLEQDSIVSPGATIEQLRADLAFQIGEKIVVRRFQHWRLGDGLSIPKHTEGYAAEVHRLVSTS